VTDWPVALRGVTETVVTTRGPDERWNAAALGIRADTPATATTWGNTRTRRNFHREGAGVVQFVSDPVVFARAALSIHEVDEPVLESADAWARVEVDCVGEREEDETRVEEWQLAPVESEVVRERVPTVNRGFNAVVEATVAASRLGVPGYGEDVLRDRLDYFTDVVDACGGAREREAMAFVERCADGD